MSNRPHTESDRGQLVLISAVIIAVSFVPITAAYLQLGYHADIEARGDTPASDSLATTRQQLQRAVDDAVTNNSSQDTIHSRLRPRVSAIERESATTGIAQRVSYNNTTAVVWASTNCPNGTAHRFGPCTADRGVVVQQRVGETHVVAVAFDVALTTKQGRLEATVIVRPVVTNRSVHAAQTDTRRGPSHRTQPVRPQRARTVPTRLLR